MNEKLKEVEEFAKNKIEENVTKQNVLKYWKEIVIFVLLIISLFFWQRTVSKDKEIEKIKAEQNSAQVLSDINKKLEVIQQHQAQYVQIDTKISSINNNIKKSKTERVSLEKNKPIKEKEYENFKKANIKEISKFFNDNGYPNSIEPSQK